MAGRSQPGARVSTSADETRDPYAADRQAQLRDDPDLQEGLSLNQDLRYCFIRSIVDPSKVIPAIYSKRQAIEDDKIFAMYEADIILGEVPILTAVTNDIISAEEPIARAGGTQQAVAITGERFRWPEGKIPYQIHDGLPNKARVTDAIRHWEQRTGGAIRFVPKSGENFVTFRRGRGCASSVGMIEGEQFIELAESCSTGNVIHEIGHTVGLWHEQSREDRDKHVKIVWPNIKEDMLHNFFQHIVDGDDIGSYDYGSIMHYNATAFTRNGAPTIVTPGGQAIGQRIGLSDGDVAAVRALYTRRADPATPDNELWRALEPMLPQLLQAIRGAMDEANGHTRTSAPAPAGRVAVKSGAY